jgi:hypothetical protein
MRSSNGRILWLIGCLTVLAVAALFNASGSQAGGTGELSVGAAAALPYQLQPGSPTALQNFYNPAALCNWSGIGGQVFGRANQSMSGLVVEVSGTLEGKNVLQLALTGNEPALGPGGYVITLADHLAASTGTLSLVLKDLQGNALSQAIGFNTYADCHKNMLVINLMDTSNLRWKYYPLIRR